MTDEGEDCDGADIPRSLCVQHDLGFVDGAVACSAACTYDFGTCVVPDGCGDGVVAGIEACDGSNLQGASCTSLGFDPGGILMCAPGCVYDTSGCGTCGDGAMSGAEACDGSDLGGATCESVGQGWVGGVLACGADCSYETGACTAPEGCGNGTLDPGEECDDDLLGGASCLEVGHTSGTLACFGGCVLDPSGCFTCGNGTREEAEVCDGADLGGETCAGVGFDGGNLGCAPTCDGFDVSGCYVCGDGMVDSPELCDGADLNGNTCVSIGAGFTGGTLACTPGCDAWDTSACTGPPSTPTPRKPMNGSYKGSIFVPGSLRPEFTWEPSSGSGPITYELEYATDPSFPAGATTTATGVDLSHQPASDLPVELIPPVGNRYFWRIRACNAYGCSSFSPTWYVDVGRSFHDLNGDGYADIVVGTPLDDTMGPDAGKLSVYYGGPSPMSGTPDAVLYGGVQEGFAKFCRFAGDLNGDGFSEIVVQTGFGGWQPARARVYLGGTGVPPVLGLDLPASGSDAWVPNPLVQPARDVNADFFADLVVGVPDADDGGTGSGRVEVYLGGPGTVLDPTPDWVINGAPGDELGRIVAGAADMDGDGFADILASSGIPAEIVRVYGGAGLGTSSPTPTRLFGPVPKQGSTYNREAVSAALGTDVNDDAFGDTLVAFGGPMIFASALLYLGDASGPLDATPSLEVPAPAGAKFWMNGITDFDGDVDGDGFADILIGGSDNDVVWLYLGACGAGQLDDTLDGILSPYSGESDFSRSFAIAGDVNGDGVDDVIVGAPSNAENGTNAGAVYLFLSPSFLSLTPPLADVVLLGVEVEDRLGWCVD